MKIRYKISLWLIGAVLLAVFGCADTQLTQVWKSETYKGGPLQKILVVGISENLKNRTLFEQTFVARLQEQAPKSVSCLSVIPADKGLKTEDIQAKAKELGMEAYLVTHLVGKEKKVVDSSLYRPYPDYYSHFGSYYTTVDQYTRYPGSMAEHEFVRLETRLYDVRTDELIWSSASESIDPESAKEVIDSLCLLVIKDLTDKNLLKK
jgi:hypothetical protein